MQRLTYLQAVQLLPKCMRRTLLELYERANFAYSGTTFSMGQVPRGWNTPPEPCLLQAWLNGLYAALPLLLRTPPPPLVSVSHHPVPL